MKIYLIYSNTSQYEESNVVIGFKLTENEAKESVEKLKTAYRKAYEFQQNSINSFHREFNDTYTFNSIPSLPEPKWQSGLKQSEITDEMKAERKAIQDRNVVIANLNSQAYAQRQLDQMVHMAKIIEPVRDEDWFKEYFTVTDRSISCSAYCLVEGHEFIYEECEEI